MSRRVEIVPGLVITKNAWTKMQREWDQVYQFAVEGKMQEWDELLSRLQVEVMNKIQHDNIRHAGVIQQRLEAVSRHFAGLAIRARGMKND